MELLGRDLAVELSVEPAREPGDRARDDEGPLPVETDRDADEGRPLVVVADRPQREEHAGRERGGAGERSAGAVVGDLVRRSAAGGRCLMRRSDWIYIAVGVFGIVMLAVAIFGD